MLIWVVMCVWCLFATLLLRRREHPCVSLVHRIVDDTIFPETTKRKLHRALCRATILRGTGTDHVVNKADVYVYEANLHNCDSLLHELAHVATGEYGHGREFAVNLALLRYAMVND